MSLVLERILKQTISWLFDWPKISGTELYHLFIKIIMDNTKAEEMDKIGKEKGIGQKPAENADPRANDNIKNKPDNTTDEDKSPEKTGTEITDGEAG